MQFILDRVSKLQSLLLCIAAFVASSYGYSIDCSSFYQQDWGTPVGDVLGGYCQINYADSDEVNLVAINGDLAGKTLADVQFLYVSGYGSMSEGTDRLPSNLGTLVPNLVFLSWNGARLKHISASDLAAWPNLIQLSLSNNMIRQLDGDLLSNNPLLHTIDFTMNSISQVGPGFFDGLTALTQINFYSNKCVDMYMSSMDIEQTKADILFFCGPLPVPVSNVCPAACSARIAAVEATVATAAAQVKTVADFVALL